MLNAQPPAARAGEVCGCFRRQRGRRWQCGCCLRHSCRQRGCSKPACSRRLAPGLPRSLPSSYRDIKPQNLLVNISSHALKLCDFGSAKPLQRGDANISYICSRYYRAPELIFGATDYSVAIDVSSQERGHARGRAQSRGRGSAARHGARRRWG